MFLMMLVYDDSSFFVYLHELCVRIIYNGKLVIF